MKNTIKTPFLFFDQFLSKLTKRERFLLYVLCLLGIISSLYPYFSSQISQILKLQNEINKSRSYLQKNKNSDLAYMLHSEKKQTQQLRELIALLNAPSLEYLHAFKIINQYAIQHAISLWSLDSSNENSNYEISLSGNATFPKILAFFAFIETLPLLHLTHFEVFQNGNFALTLKNHKILNFNTLDPKVTLPMLISELRNSLQKEQAKMPLSQLQDPIQSPPKLEAIFNQKAKINGKWLKVGENIAGFKLIDLKTTDAILQSPKTILKLTLERKKNLQ